MASFDTLGYVFISSGDYSVQDADGNPASLGDPGSILVWSSVFFRNDTVSAQVNENDTGVLQVSTAGDNWADDSFPYTGYTVTINGEDYPVFIFTSADALVIPSPAAGSTNPPQFDPNSTDDFPGSGESNVYTGDIPDFEFCFLADTAISVPGGSCAVQYLKIGDMVLTADGRAVPVLWLGHQRVQAFAHPEKKAPVLIEAGALGDGLPLRDLRVTADHGMVLDGMIVNASALVNGTTIRFLTAAEMGMWFTVYDVETEVHEHILAEGAAAESFIDVVGRAGFDNYNEYLDLYGADRIIPECPVTRVSSQRLLPQPIRERVGIAAPQVRAVA